MARKHIIAFLTERPGMSLRGPAFGRVVINQDGSLVIKKVSKADAGMYTLVVYLSGSKKEIGYGKLTVYGE